jgi:hypothetical protein
MHDISPPPARQDWPARGSGSVSQLATIQELTSFAIPYGVSADQSADEIARQFRSAVGPLL